VDWAGTILHDGAAVTDLACAIVVLASRSCGRGRAWLGLGLTTSVDGLGNLLRSGVGDWRHDV
jgi:hypothetical protein